MFENIRISKKSPVPLYFQLKNELISLINQKDIKWGDFLPSETDLMKILNVSRTTIRLAYRELKNEGWIESERGKGTYVIPRVPREFHANAGNISGLSEDIKKLGHEPGAILVEKIYNFCTQEIAQQLQLDSPQLILTLCRIRTADNVPIGLSYAHLNTVKFPKLLELDFSGVSIYKIIREELGLSIKWISQTIRAESASARLAESLKISVHSPILKLIRTSYVENHVALEYVESFMVGNLFQIQNDYYETIKH